MATVIKYYGMFDEWADSIGLSYFDGKLHSVGQARQANIPDNLHYVWDTSGNRLHKITAPFSAEAEMLCSKVIPDKLTCVGGTNANQIVQFDPALGYSAAGWSVLVSNFSAILGPRAMSQGCDCNGRFHIFGGRNNSTHQSTADFVTWTTHADLPAYLTRWSAGACCEHNGKIYLIGGATNLASPYQNAQMLAAELAGLVIEYDPVADSYTQLAQDDKFRCVWCDAVSDGIRIYFSPGYVDAAQFSFFNVPPTRSGNQRGLWSSAAGVTWAQETILDGAAYMHESHRRGMINMNGVAVAIGGNFTNSMFRLSPIN